MAKKVSEKKKTTKPKKVETQDVVLDEIINIDESSKEEFNNEPAEISDNETMVEESGMIETETIEIQEPQVSKEVSVIEEPILEVNMPKPNSKTTATNKGSFYGISGFETQPLRASRPKGGNFGRGFNNGKRVVLRFED